MADHPGTRTRATLLDWLHDPTNMEAWGEFAVRYTDKIHDWCRRRGLQESDADEVTQNLVTGIHSKMKNFVYDPAKGRYRDWLRKVTINACKDTLDHSGLGTVQGLREDVQAPNDPLEHVLEEQARLEVLNTSMALVQPRVTARDWQIFQARVFEQRGAKVVAAELGMTFAAVHMVTSRVKKLIREQVQELGGTDQNGEEDRP